MGRFLGLLMILSCYAPGAWGQANTSFVGERVCDEQKELLKGPLLLLFIYRLEPDMVQYPIFNIDRGLNSMTKRSPYYNGIRYILIKQCNGEL